MRKLILIACFALASAAAHATDAPSPTTAANDAAPKVETTEQKASAPPAEATAPAKPARRHVSVQRHEDGEQKARRIAARYGVYW
jgi:hypothetical protein